MGLLSALTGGSSDEAAAAQKAALAALQGVRTPTTEELSLPELQKYAVAANMSPAQMQAFLQQYNAYNDQNIDQTGTSAQKQALAQLAEVANAGAEGTPTERAQVEQINQDAARNLAGQRGAIENAARARGVPAGLLAAALSNIQAGQGAQDAHMAALNAQSNAYQQALQALSQGASAGNALQGQQNTQANTVAAAQNAMQQFNAANQQAANAANAGYQQQANQTNTQNLNDTSRANTGLANQRTQYNAQVPQTVFQDALSKATGIAGANNNLANLYQQQGQQNAGIWSGLIGAGSTLAGGAMGGPAGATAAGSIVGNQPGVGAISTPNNPNQYKPLGYSEGGEVCDFTDGGSVPGQARVPGDSPMNDTVHARLSPGEVVIPRSIVQNHPEDIATLLAAMRHLRGAK